MATVLISEAEKMYIIHGIQENLRSDGRSCLEYRFVEIETGVVSNCSGSSHVRLANTDIFVGIKAEIDAPDPRFPDRGRVEVFVDCTANASPEFEGRGGEAVATKIRLALAKTYSSPKCFDLESLAVIPGRQVWVLYVDVLVLECGGSLLDAVAIAVKAALYDLKIPKVSVAVDENGQPEIEVSDDPFDVTSLDIANVPCMVTLSKIGQQFVLDATPEEEACAVGSLSVAVSRAGKIMGVFKGGIGSLHPENVGDVIEVARDLGVALNKAIDEQLELEGSIRGQTKGFLR